MKKTIIAVAVLTLTACGGSDSGDSVSADSPAGAQSTSTVPQAVPQEPASSQPSEPASTTPAPSTPVQTEPVAVEPPAANPSACKLSTIDQAMLDAVNKARAQARSCGSSSMPAVAPVEWDCTLASVAAAHSSDMASNNFFNHTGSNGLSMVNRIDNAGYVYGNLGENIAAGQATVESVMAGWIDSPGHCRNIMSANFTELGAGRRINDNSQYRIYWTQNFGRPR